MLFSTAVSILLRPSEVRLTKLSSLSLRRRTRCQAVPSATGGEPWKLCVDTLGELLAAWGRSAFMDVVISDNFLRYALVPWSESLINDAERMAFARLTFSRIYGSMADDWVVALDEQRVGQASLASAIDPGLLQALQEVAIGRGVRLRSLRTALGERINRHRRRLRDNEFCFASLEPGRLTLAFHDKDGWLAVRSRRIWADAVERLPAVLRQETAAAGANMGGTLYLVSELPAELLPAEIAEWRLMRLDEPNPVSSPTEEPVSAE